jgi:4-alpha-glucanotransferase
VVPRFRGKKPKGWGVFAPTHALRSTHNWGIGDYADLARLVEWASGLGADFVGTLPLLAAFLDDPFDASPYSSASRLFFNEAFVSVDSIPELARSENARVLRQSPELGERLLALRGGDIVDYREQMAL